MTPEEFIRQAEGLDGHQFDGSYVAVWDSLGKVWTIGPGLTAGINRNTHMTQAEVDAALHAELSKFEANVDAYVHVQLTEN